MWQRDKARKEQLAASSRQGAEEDDPPASPEGEADGGQARGPQYDPSDLRGRHGETARRGLGC
ncbi:MAG: hypothetical protein V3U56_02480 [Syntrophobacteria bacterium]